MRSIAAALALVGAGCSVGQSYRRPQMETPAAFAGSTGGTAAVDPGWWNHFHSAELDALMQRAMAGNFDLQAAYARVEEARAQAQIAGAPLYPSVNLAASANGGLGPSSTRVSGVFAQASYELDFWGKNRAAAGSAAALAQASAFDAETVAVTLEASVADTYFEVLSLRERVRLAQRIADDARRVLSLVQAQAAGGIASQLEVEQQRNALATFQASTVTLQQQLEQTLHLLAILTGETPESFQAQGASAMELAVPQVQAGLPASALQRRPDVGAAEARLISAHFDIDKARAAFFPSFTLTGQAGLGNTSLGNFFPPVAIVNLVGGLLQPIFAGGALQGQLRYDRAHAVELAANYRQTVIAALQDVEDGLTAAQRSQDLEEANEDAVESARHAAQLARARFEAGTVDFLTVLTTERTRYLAEDAMLTTRLSRLQAAVRLFRALGGGFGTGGKPS
jgi:NodT family efflux transporter outer membrane factor (OMF) lipoprotein